MSFSCFDNSNFDFNALANKPCINGHMLTGCNTLQQIGVNALIDCCTCCNNECYVHPLVDCCVEKACQDVLCCMDETCQCVMDQVRCMCCDIYTCISDVDTCINCKIDNVCCDIYNCISDVDACVNCKIDDVCCGIYGFRPFGSV